MKNSLQSYLRRAVSFPIELGISILYLVTHLPGLLTLPVFADEAIYIRWSQLILDDPTRYAFFSMADGKPPFFFWITALVLPFFSNPLFAGRLISLVAGIASVFVVGKIVRLCTQSKSAYTIALLAMTILPYWFFHHRMALIDAVNTLWIACAFLLALTIALTVFHLKKTAYDQIPHILLLGLSIALALLTKLSLFLLPVLLTVPIIAFTLELENGHRHRGRKDWVESYLMLGIGIIFGMGIFALLRISPLFGALFSRGQDFTFTPKELLKGELRYVVFESLPRTIGWIATYMSPSFFILPLFALLSSKRRRSLALLLLCAALYAGPLVLFGRVLWPRYFLPVGLFLTLASAVAFGELWDRSKLRIVALLLGFVSLVLSVRFILPSWTSPEKIPFVPADQSQYLLEWSAGYGNAQIVDFIRERQRSTDINERPKILVLTEGTFGTLPDGILMYFHGRNQLADVEIQGVGVSIRELPAQYIARIPTEEVYYVVNSHRFGIVDQSGLEKALEIERPHDGPSLLMFRVLQ